MKKHSSLDKFKYDFMKQVGRKKPLEKRLPFQPIEDRLEVIKSKVERAKDQLEFKFEDLKEFGQSIKNNKKMIFYISPDKHQLIYNLMSFSSETYNEFYKSMQDTFSTLVSMQYR